MSDKAWKALERRIAESLGTVRTPLSGGSSRHTTSDTLHEKLYVECKLRKASSVHTLFTEIRIEAAKETKIPVLVIHLSGTSRTLALVDWFVFVKLWTAYVNQQEPKNDSNDR